MSLFQTILESIENPNHAGSQQDLHGLLNLAQLLPGVQGAEQQVQPILGVLGSHLQDALNQQQQTGGQAAVQQTVSNLSQPGAGLQEIENLFGQERFNGLIGEIEEAHWFGFAADPAVSAGVNSSRHEAARYRDASDRSTGAESGPE